MKLAQPCSKPPFRPSPLSWSTLSLLHTKGKTTTTTTAYYYETVVVLLCGKTRGDIHLTTHDHYISSLAHSLYTLPLPLHSHSHHQLYAHATETQHPAPAFGIATDRQGTRRIHTYTLRLQSDIAVQQYYSSVLLIDSSTFLHPSRGWLAPQSQARHGLTHQHHPSLRQHQIRGRAHTPNRLQALRHMSRREPYLSAM